MAASPGTYDFNVEDACRRYSLIYAGAIADVLDEMGYRNQCLPSSIQGLTIDSKLAGVAMTVEGQATLSLDPEEIYIPVLKMLGDLRPGDVIVSQPNDSVCAHLGELSSEVALFRGARDINYILKLGFPVFCRYRTPRDIVGRRKLVTYGILSKSGRLRFAGEISSSATRTAWSSSRGRLRQRF